MARTGTRLPTTRPLPAWVLSVAFHLVALAAVAVLVPVIILHKEFFGPPIQVVQRVEPEERVLLKWKSEAELPSPPLVEVVEEPVQEVEAREADQASWCDIAVVETSPTSVQGAYPVCAVGLRTRPRAVLHPAAPPAVLTPQVPSCAVPAVPPVPVRQPLGVAQQSGPSRAARVLDGLDPRYPERQRVAGRSATVLLMVHVDERGRPEEVELLSDDVHPDFVKAALAAARQARYEPALAEGKPVPFALRVRIQFQLQ